MNEVKPCENWLAYSLGKFYPSRLHEVTIAEEMSRWLLERVMGKVSYHLNFQPLPIGVRNPEDHLKISSQDYTVKQWHRDGLGKNALNRQMVPSLKRVVLWSNKSATELMEMSTERILHFEPFDVVRVDNVRVMHRCPPPEPDRWFARLLEPMEE